MSRIGQIFADRRRKALIAYVTVGYPSIAATLEIVPLLAGSGCDIIELGIPFSDPLADGPTIQRASYRALSQGVTPQTCLDVARTLRRQVETPLVLMGYYNPVLHYGLEAFSAAGAEAGIDGLIIPDLPPEEGVELEELAAEKGLDMIYLLAPTSTDERVELVAGRSHGFIYLVSLTGVTGARASLPEGLERFIARVRQRASQPLCVGFGVSTPEQAGRVARVADGVIVGSRIIDLIEADASLASLSSFVSSLKEALQTNGGC